MAQHRAAAVTAAARSALMPAFKSYCAEGTAISMEMTMGKPVHLCDKQQNKVPIQ
jgi:hypothetical protein